MRNFGFTGYDQVDSIGTNAKMSEMNAAMGLGTLPLLQENMERNQRHQERYHQLLRGIPGIVPFRVRPGCTSNYNNFSILINKEFGLTRDQLCHILWRENILARRYYFPGCHKQPPYKEINAGLKLPVTERISNSILCLPCYPELTESLQNGIVDIIRQSHTNVNRVMAYFSKNSQSFKHPWE
jgi:dTDP-4-amino-4,6-dideoxygalactose transaminase